MKVSRHHTPHHCLSWTSSENDEANTDMQMWLYAIANAIESCINGTSTVRTFDDSKLRTASGALDDHALPASRSRPFGLGLPMPSSVPATPGNRRSMPPLSEKRTRKTSFKNVLKQSGEKWLNRHSTSFDLHLAAKPVPSASASDRVTPPPPTGHAQPTAATAASPSRSVKESWDGYDDSHDTAIEQRVYEMAGLGLGDSPSTATSAAQRRVQSEGVSRHLSVDPSTDTDAGMTRSRSAEQHQRQPPREPEMSMKLLRELADRPGNNRCADCKRPTKASQWATLSICTSLLSSRSHTCILTTCVDLRGVPMVLFLCIRCCGLHRGLGTHISKPRAINLDHWSPESIALACEWGNERGNAIWERMKPGDVVATDE